MIDAVFVYGTLKKGECRAGLWPVQPVAVLEAWARGTLFDRHDYPAMTAGRDRVLGERWEFEHSDISKVLESLDEIEGTNQPGEKDLYLRVTVETWGLDDRPLGVAYTYHYAKVPSLDGFARLYPLHENSLVCWPPA